QTCWLVSLKRTFISKMRCSLPFTQRSRASGAAKGDEDNAWSRLLETTAKCMALGSSTGVMAGSMAGSPQDEQQMTSREQLRAAVVRSQQRGRVAIVIADNLRTHTSACSLLVRSLLAEFKERLYRVYTPAYDPDV